MRIGLNATAFLPGKMGGMEVYFRNLLKFLQQVDQDNRYSVLCDRHYIHELPITNPDFAAVQCNFSRPSPGWLVRGVLKNTIKVDILRPIMNRYQVDVIHHPFSMLMPLQCRIPSVLTFHDMQHEFFPEFFSVYEMKVRRAFYRSSAERATRIIAISEHARSCLVEKYGVKSEKIDVIYAGYDPTYRVLADPSDLEKIRLKYQLNKPFMYYPAATWPHKNHRKLFEALKVLKDRYRFDGQLILTGVAMQSHAAILEEIRRFGLQDMVRVLGYLPAADLPRLYNLARLMVFPSLFEGLGMPLVESMACGCPIACSNVTSIPEVVGDAAVIFDPSSREEMAEKIWLLWTDDGVRQGLVRSGLERVKLFSWEDAARKTVGVYRKTLEDSGCRRTN